MISKWKSILILILMIVAVAGCSEESGITPTFSVTIKAKEEPVLSTVPTSTPLPPTPSPVSIAPTFTAVPSVTPEPTATLNPVINISLQERQDFGDTRNPLTGEELEEPNNLLRRPIAVKISNAPPRWVRPQSGLSQADIVFEHVTEGLITRFTAIFYGDTPKDLGPIRSARLIDLQIPLMYDAALAYSGSSIGVSRKLFASEFSSRVLRTNSSGYYRTGANKPYEHTLYADPDGLWQALTDRSENYKPTFEKIMTFSSLPPRGGESASEVTVDYREWTIIDWRYDEESGRYKRWADGEVHLDANTGEQIDAANVIILFADHTLDTTICETLINGSCLAYSQEVDLMGTGPAMIFRDGLVFSVRWRRDRAHDLLTFEDNSGTPVPLQIGNSWIQVVPTSYPDPVDIRD